MLQSLKQARMFQKGGGHIALYERVHCTCDYGVRMRKQLWLNLHFLPDIRTQGDKLRFL